MTGSGGYGLSWSDTLARSVTYYALAGSQIRRPAAIVADQPSQLRSASNRADYVVIAHGELMDAVRPLLNQRQLQGLRVAAVDVQDVYDEYSGGLVDPEAIRAFVAYAYQHWAPPALSYVLLVGDGHYDFLDHYGYGAVNLHPALPGHGRSLVGRDGGRQSLCGRRGRRYFARCAAGTSSGVEPVRGGGACRQDRAI